MKKLQLNNDLIAGLDQLKQRLAHVLPMEDMEQIHGGACGGVCYVTCSQPCTSSCIYGCGENCTVTCSQDCIALFDGPWPVF